MYATGWVPKTTTASNQGKQGSSPNPLMFSSLDSHLSKLSGLRHQLDHGAYQKCRSVALHLCVPLCVPNNTRARIRTRPEGHSLNLYPLAHSAETSLSHPQPLSHTSRAPVLVLLTSITSCPLLFPSFPLTPVDTALLDPFSNDLNVTRCKFF